MSAPRASRKGGARKGPPPRRQTAVAPVVSAADEFVARLQALRARVAPRVPDMDPGDLLLILRCLILPTGTGRRFFPRRVAPGIYVP